MSARSVSASVYDLHLLPKQLCVVPIRHPVPPFKQLPRSLAASGLQCCSNSHQSLLQLRILRIHPRHLATSNFSAKPIPWTLMTVPANRLSVATPTMFDKAVLKLMTIEGVCNLLGGRLGRRHVPTHRRDRLSQIRLLVHVLDSHLSRDASSSSMSLCLTWCASCNCCTKRFAISISCNLQASTFLRRADLPANWPTGALLKRRSSLVASSAKSDRTFPSMRF